MRRVVEQIAAPVAVALGGIYVIDEPAVGAALLVAGLVLQIDVGRTLLPLPVRALRAANLVRRCIPGWWKEPDYIQRSYYGVDASVARHIERLEQHAARRRLNLPRRTRSYARIERRVRRVIEELARCPWP